MTDTNVRDEPSKVGWWLLVGAALIIGSVVLVHELLPLRGAAVSKELRVHVFVVDADTHQPLANVPVLVMHWVDGPPAGADWSKTIRPVLAECHHEQFLTDDRGTVVFRWHFHAIIGTNAFGTSGGFLRDTWLEIAPPGYGAVFLPLDGQSAERRDYGNKTPIVVTVFLKKPSGTPIASATQQWRTQVPELDDIILAVHEDLLQLRTTHAWLSGYNRDCFQGHSIIFMPSRKDEKGMPPQQPDQLYIGYGSIDQNKGDKYANAVEEVPACQFPSLRAKMYAHILVRGEANAKCAAAIRDGLIKRCEAWHKDDLSPRR